MTKINKIEAGIGPFKSKEFTDGDGEGVGCVCQGSNPMHSISTFSSCIGS